MTNTQMSPTAAALVLASEAHDFARRLAFEAEGTAQEPMLDALEAAAADAHKRAQEAHTAARLAAGDAGVQA